MDGRTDGKPYEREDGDTQVFYRFGHESSLGDGPQDPRWDAADADTASAIAPQERWNAFGRPEEGDAPAWDSAPPSSASPWDTSPAASQWDSTRWDSAHAAGQEATTGQSWDTQPPPRRDSSTEQSWDA